MLETLRLKRQYLPCELSNDWMEENEERAKQAFPSGDISVFGDDACSPKASTVFPNEE